MLRFPCNFQGKAHSVANAVTCAFNALGSPVACFLSGVVDLLARNLWHYLNESGEICRNEHTSPRIQGVQIKVISGDNPETVSEIAKQAGIEGAYEP